MNWMFLAPGFLTGFAALSIPVILHLMQRKPTSTVEFPSLRFLREIVQKKMRMNNIQRWMVLVARCLFMALLALAFVRPFLAHLFQSSATALVVVLDNSYSTRYQGQFARAKSAALARVRQLPEGSFAGLILPLPKTKTVVSLTADRDSVLRAIEQVTVSAAGNNYETALRVADNQLSQIQCGHRIIYVAGDNQASAWQPVDFNRSLGPAVQLQVEPSPARDHDELVIEGIKMGAPLTSAGQRLVAHVQIHDYRQQVTPIAASLTPASTTDEASPPADPAQEGTLQLSLDGVPTAQLAISLHPGEVGIRDIEFTVPELKPIMGSIRVNGAGTNDAPSSYFALNPTAALKVGLWPPQDDGTLDTLAVALAPSKMTSALEPAELKDPAEISGVSLLLIRPDGHPDTTWESALTTAIRGGKPAIILADASHETQLWMQDLGLKMSDRRKEKDALHLGSIDFNHPPMEKFRQPGNGDLFLVHFQKAPQFEQLAEGQLIASFDDGSPAIFEKSIDRGEVLVLSSSINSEATNWTLLSTFVPFLHEAIKHLVPGEIHPEGVLVGESLSGEVLSGSSEVPGVAMVKNNNQTRLVAVNVDPVESDLAPWTGEAQLSKLVAPPSENQAPAALSETQYTEREQSQMTWRYLLIGALLLLCAEMFLANRTAI